MKTPQKKSLKGKSRLSLPKARNSQTITSLFSQISKSVEDKVREGENAEVTDDDVQIVHVEVKADKYFKKDSAENCAEAFQNKGVSKVPKLKLRRSKLSTEGKGSVDGKPQVVTSSVNCKLKPGMTETETYVDKLPTPSQGSSQKENKKIVDCTSVGDQPASEHTPSRKLSLRKRRSDNDYLLSAPRQSKRSKSEDKSTADSSMSKQNTESSSGSKNSVTKRHLANKPVSIVNTNKNLTPKRNKECDSTDSNIVQKVDHAGDNKHGTETNEILAHANLGGKRKKAQESSVCEGKNPVNRSEGDEEPLDSHILGSDDSSDSDSVGIGGITRRKGTNKRKSKKNGVHKGDKPVGSRGSVSLIDDDSNSQISVSETVDDMDAEDEQDKSKYRDRTPYYLENFSIILDSVMEEQDYVRLFNPEDIEVISTFRRLTEPAQKLYVRLFSRKLTWHLSHKISYSEIADDLTPVLAELITAHLVISATELNDLSTVLSILPAVSLKALAKSFNIGLNQTKPQLVEALTKQSKQNTIGSFFTKKCRAGAMVMLDRAKKLLGESFKVVEEPRAVFLRILNLFSLLNYNPDEESSTASHGGLFQMLLVNMGKLVYPKYTISKKTSIFRSRDDLLRFSSALLVENDMLTCSDKGDFKGAHLLYQDAKSEFEEMKKDNEQLQWDHSLPSFLRRYTAREVYTRILSEGVEVLQRLKLYKAAVKQLQELLDQSDYCLKYRGHWYDRLALNLDQHLSQQKESLEVIKAGLLDPGVRVGHRYNLYWRAKRLCSGPKSKFSDQLADMDPVEVLEYPKVTIEGKVLPKTIPGARFTFVQESCDSEEGITVCGVEELVLDYYRLREFPEGIHAEGGVVSTLFSLYFWDVIFMDVPDVFHSPFQAHPLDHHSDHFYNARQTQIDRRLAEIEDMDEQALEESLAEVWEERHGVLCRGLNWERFTGPEQAQGLVRCLGGKALSGLLARYARDPRNTRSGFPDLTLWNPANKTVKFSEVKGPGDRLSSNQIMWLDHLMRLGIDAEVCHVKAVTGKKLKRH